MSWAKVHAGTQVVPGRPGESLPILSLFSGEKEELNMVRARRSVFSRVSPLAGLWERSVIDQRRAAQCELETCARPQLPPLQEGRGVA